jgi:hypothetical protein
MSLNDDLVSILGDLAKFEATITMGIIHNEETE